MCKYPISVTKILGAIRSETEVRRAFSLTHQPICRLGVRGVSVQKVTGSGSSTCTMRRPWTGPPVGRQGSKMGQQRQGLGARSPRSPQCCWKPHTDGRHHAAGHSESQPGRGEEAVILEEMGVGSGSGAGSRRGSWEPGLLHRRGPLQSPVWSAGA